MSRKLLLALPVCAARHAAGYAGRPAAAACGQGVLEETLIERQTREVSSQLRCVVCQGLSLQDSPSQLAQEMRAIVREKLEEGMTPAEVKAYFVRATASGCCMQPEPRASTCSSTSCPSSCWSAVRASSSSRPASWTRQAPAAGEPEPADEEQFTPSG
jgi:cytochrome c-type biogenesis protein CcmH/NrfF